MHRRLDRIKTHIYQYVTITCMRCGHPYQFSAPPVHCIVAIYHRESAGRYATYITVCREICYITQSVERYISHGVQGDMLYHTQSVERYAIYMYITRCAGRYAIYIAGRYAIYHSLQGDMLYITQSAGRYMLYQ